MNRLYSLMMLSFPLLGFAQAQIQFSPTVLYNMATDGNEAALQKLTAMAEAGDAEAQLNLGWIYHDGEVVSEDSSIAVQWFRKAAEQGLADAQFWVGWMYDVGEGVTRDFAAAVTWYRKAAEQGDTDAQYNLGLKYKDGSGVPKDLVAADMWLHVAVSQGGPFAKKSKDDLEKMMTPAQIAEAQKLSQEWKSKK
jgi:TPR repeat protein